MLRGAYLATFAAQGLAAGLVALFVTLIAGRSAAPSVWVAGASILAATGQLLLGLAVSSYGVRQARRAARAISDPGDAPVRRARSAALSQTLLSAVLLSTPAWFAAFAWATGQSLLTLFVTCVLLLLGYAFGALQLGRLARAVTVSNASGAER